MSSANSPNPTTDPAAAAAAAAAARNFTIQLWTLYAVGVSVTILRTYARVKAVGISGLRGDDILIWIGIIFYTAQTVLGYSVGNVAHGFANNGLTDAERIALSPNDPEYHLRVVGSQIQLAGWGIYSALMCFLKLSVLVFYVRLTEGLGQRYKLQIRAGFALVIATSVASVLAVLTSCVPIYRNWQIYPDPGNHCQPAISAPIVWTCYAANVTTDIYLILIPLPMLWGSSLKLAKKLASSFVLSAGIFVLVSATLKTAFVIADPVDGAQLAGQWGTREAFVAVFTTNLPMIFPLIKSGLSPLFGSVLRSTQKTYTPREGFHTIGSGGMKGHKRNPRGHLGISEFSTNLSTTSSREHIVQDIPLQSVKVSSEPSTHPYDSNGVYISKEIDVIHEDARYINTRDQRRERSRPSQAVGVAR
ncbi:hypothetical protein F5Y10DRAFT_181630 [Nemania abortiva]|nr:hypothetical protein F5Y10DRAFT_181630 [Nemania abortiva]